MPMAPREIANWTPVASRLGLVWSSMTSGTSLWPFTPPWAFWRAMRARKPWGVSWKSGAARPVVEVTRAMVYGAFAPLLPLADSAAPACPHARSGPARVTVAVRSPAITPSALRMLPPCSAPLSVGPRRPARSSWALSGRPGGLVSGVIGLDGDDEAIAPFLFGHHQGRIRIGDDGGSRGGVGGIGQADAHGEGGYPCRGHRLCEGGPQAVDDRRRLGDVAPHVDQEELLSAESTDHVAGPHRRAGNGREVTECAVARSVSVCVIENLEVVQIGERHRIGNLLVVQAAQCFFETASIQLPGQRVGGRGDFAGDQGPEKAEAGSGLCGQDLRPGPLLGVERFVRRSRSDGAHPSTCRAP